MFHPSPFLLSGVVAGFHPLNVPATETAFAWLAVTLNCTRTLWSTGLAAGRVSNAATVLKTSLFLIIC